jgi:hypothetical protein
MANKKRNIKLVTLNEVIALAMQKPNFFKELVELPLDQALTHFGMKLTDEDKATLYILIHFGTVEITAKEYLSIKFGTKGDLDIRGVWLS